MSVKEFLVVCVPAKLALFAAFTSHQRYLAPWHFC